MKHFLILALALLASTAWASPGNDGCVGNCPDYGPPAPSEVTATAEAGASSSSEQTVNVAVDTRTKNPVASAASVYATECSSGGGIQLKSLGLSKGAAGTFCQRMKLAEVYFSLGEDTLGREQVALAAREVRADSHWRNLRRVLTAGLLD